MTENWLEELKKDKESMEEKPQWKTLQNGKNVFVIDFSTKEKITRIVNINGEEQKRTYIMFNLVGDDVPKISFTTYQYMTFLKDIDIDNLDPSTKEMEVIVDVKVMNNKKVYTFNVQKKE